MSADDKPYQATPSLDLRQQIMDSRVPKNEREWWASRTIEKLERELATEREKVTMLLSDAYALTKNWHDRTESAEREVERLRAGIGECLRTNGHLADGENCTLISLKRCLHDPTAARESNGGAA